MQAESYPEMLEKFAQAVLSGDATKLSASGKEAIKQIMPTNAALNEACEAELNR